MMGKIMKGLQKARAARSTGPSHPVQQGEYYVTAPRELEGKRTDDRQELNIDYSRTKIEKVDPSIYKRNKILAHFQNSAMADHIKIIRNQILNSLKKIGGNSLLVTSANPSEGKTFTSINLGVSIAQELERTVLLVDADLRIPASSHRDFAKDFFEVGINQGLSDYLLGHAEIPDILINPGIQKLTILPGGKPSPKAAELLGSARMESLITEIKNRYREDRIVIFDSSSLLTTAEPLSLSRFVDGILLVVQAERTQPEDLKRVKELLKDQPIMGTILNKYRV